MKSSLWKTVSILTCVLAIAALIVCIAMGGCSKQLETTAGGVCYMKCYWCFRASTIVLGLTIIASFAQIFKKEADTRRVCAVFTGLGAVGTIAMNATSIVGICVGAAEAGMHCFTTALVVDIICAVIIILAFVTIFGSKPKSNKPKMTL